MALVQKTDVIRLRVEPELHEKMQQMADFHRVTISAMVRDWMYQQTARYEAARLRDQAKALTAPQPLPAPVPPPEAFELEKTPAKRSKPPAAPKNREQRRAEAADSRQDKALEAATLRRNAMKKKASPH
jgi:hypothetical protein